MRTKPRRPMPLALAAVVTTCVAVLLGSAQASPPPPQGDTVRDWNAHAVAAIFNGTGAPVPGAGQTPPVGGLHMAMVQLAVYDAVNSIQGGFEPYLDGLPPAAPWSSLDAAVATAAHDVLDGLGIDPVPPLPDVVRDRLDKLYADELATIPDGPEKAGGIAAGAAAAAAMLSERTGDGRYVPFSFTEGTDAGEWRRTGAITDPFAWVGKVTPFTLESTSQFRTDGPYDLSSGQYANDYREVKKLGSATSTSRTEEQTALAMFFTATPVDLYQSGFRKVTEGEGIGLVNEARFFAQVNVSGADAFINCWDDKEYWHFWRPITAIQNGDDDDNRLTSGDPDWTSLAAAPPYPDHPSGYNCITGASMEAARAFLGDANHLSLTNTALGVTREYDRFSDVTKNTIVSRMLLGIHFRNPDAQGADLGKNVARWVDTNYFKRVN